MTINKLFLITLLMSILIALTHIYMSYAQEKYFLKLEEEAKLIISNARKFDIIDSGNAEYNKGCIINIIKNGKDCLIILSNQDNRILERRYYSMRVLRIQDIFGDNGEIVKRIINNKSGKSKIIIKYDKMGNIAVKDFIDKDDKVIRQQRNDYLPFGGRTGY